jgi:AcrR family transcriptional regulator
VATKTIDKPANARSRRTREALLTAAREILQERDFDALTMTAIADRAGVSRKAAYLHFATRADVLGELFDHVAATEGLEASLEAVWAAPDAAQALDRWAEHLARYHPRVVAVDRALQRVWRSDPAAAAHRERVVAEQLTNTRRLTRRLADEHLLAPGWTTDTAADMLYALISSDIVEALLADRKWSCERLAEHLALLFRSTFVACRRVRSGGAALDHRL